MKNKKLDDIIIEDSANFDVPASNLDAHSISLIYPPKLIGIKLYNKNNEYLGLTTDLLVDENSKRIIGLVLQKNIFSTEQIILFDKIESENKKRELERKFKEGAISLDYGFLLNSKIVKYMLGIYEFYGRKLHLF